MRIVSCHIEGFGKIIGEDYNFNPDENVICRENGYGKSTMATFIKTMLYGFDDENKRSLKDKEREKYRPWTLGAYGGSLVFEYNGNEYEVTRQFGKNENDDFFEVREKRTNRVCDKFAGNTLGLTLFGIDRDSFFRTAYIASRDRDRRDINMTDSIRAKLGNLTDATDDINNYENVTEKIKKKLNELTPDRKTGRIKALKTEIAELNNKYRNIDNIDKSIEILEEQIQALHGKIDRNNETLKALREEEKQNLDVTALKIKKESYNSLLKEFEESKDRMTKSASVFENRIPSREELERIDRMATESEGLLKSMSESRFHKDDEWNELKVRFAAKSPTEEEVKTYLDLWNECSTKQNSAIYSEQNARNALERYADNKKNEIQRENENRIAEATKINDARKKKMILYFVATALLLGLCAALFAILRPAQTAMILLCAMPAVLAIVFVCLVFIQKLTKREKAEALNAEINPEDYKDECDEYRELMRKASEERSELTFVEGQMTNFFAGYGLEFSKDTVINDLLKLLDETKTYREGLVKLENYDRLSVQYELNERKIAEFFESIGKAVPGEVAEEINRMQEALTRYDELKKDTDRKKLMIDNFEADNNIAELLKEIPADLRDIEDIRDEAADIAYENDEAKDRLSQFRNNLEKLQDDREELENLSTLIEEKTEEYESLSDSYRILELTSEYLSKAKDELSAKYTKPIMDAFEKYYYEFADDAGLYRIDTDFTMTKIETGAQRDPSDLSLGLRDVTDFCLRLALIEAMYGKEKPFIVLDDPFINMDNANLEAAKKLVKKVSEEYQIIYFTCHESRGKIG